jgi:hypothetical protein
LFEARPRARFCLILKKRLTRFFKVVLCPATVHKREHDALPLIISGRGIVFETIRLDAPLIKGWKRVSSTASKL